MYKTTWLRTWFEECFAELENLDKKSIKWRINKIV